MNYAYKTLNKMDRSFNCCLSVIIDDMTYLFTLNNQNIFKNSHFTFICCEIWFWVL